MNDDGDNTLTGSSGGDNSTDNTTTYKDGAGVSDAVAQNLIKNATNVTGIWTISNLAANGTNITGTQPFGLWLYIKDATALAKFKSSGTCLTIKIGSDSSNYYYKTFERNQLSTGWNWISSNTVNVNALSQTGTVTGSIDTFIIEIITNNATDTFVAGDVVYDLLRQWSTTDLVKDVESVTYDTTDASALVISKLTVSEANGFLLSKQALFNTDSSPLIDNTADYTGVGSVS